jgi:hypothetical protein
MKQARPSPFHIQAWIWRHKAQGSRQAGSVSLGRIESAAPTAYENRLRMRSKYAFDSGGESLLEYKALIDACLK